MPLRVSINGTASIAADSVIVYDDAAPVAIAINTGGGVVFADALRDADFDRVALSVGVKPVPTVNSGEIKGSR